MSDHLLPVCDGCGAEDVPLLGAGVHGLRCYECVGEMLDELACWRARPQLEKGPSGFPAVYEEGMAGNFPWFVVFKDEGADPERPWRWRLEDRAGRVLASSAESWPSAQAVESALPEIRAAAAEARIFGG
jgi:hypothetical protein